MPITNRPWANCALCPGEKSVYTILHMRESVPTEVYVLFAKHNKTLNMPHSIWVHESEVDSWSIWVCIECLEKLNIDIVIYIHDSTYPVEESQTRGKAVGYEAIKKMLKDNKKG